MELNSRKVCPECGSEDDIYVSLDAVIVTKVHNLPNGNAEYFTHESDMYDETVRHLECTNCGNVF